MNYFEFYEIEESLEVDSQFAKKKFLELSRKYHPDFYANKSEEKQMVALEFSTLNTNAYKTFQSRDKTIEYVLNLHELLGDEAKNALDPMFLMEMMEINEELMELEFDDNPKSMQKIRTSIENTESELLNSIENDLKSYPGYEENEKTAALQRAKDYFLKTKYILRIKETLNKFAGRS